MRIFLSYGHDRYASLALRLKRDLELLRHEVWFDVEHLKPGGDWERYIEEGFDQVANDGETGRFLLLMTPHSVRRPDGYCLNELARAFGRNLPIIPVMVSTVEVPLSVCRLQWLDMRQCFPAEQHEEQYAKQFKNLVTALTQKQVPFDGVQQRLLNYLNPIRYDDIERHLTRFTGRQWVMSEVDAWMASSRRMLWITGEAGVGKSALAAWLCNKRPEIAAYHFCRFGNSDRVDARKALFSLAYQLSTQLPVYQERLNSSALEKVLIETSLPTVFDRLFVQLLNDPVPITNQPHIFLIDALDEATNTGSNELASLIGSEFHRMPEWARVIITSRPHEGEINFALQALDPWKLDAGRAENLQDIREYLRRELRPLTTGDEPLDDTVDMVMEKSEGLFLYASWVRQELQYGRLSLRRVEEFPRGLGGVYAHFFQRYFPDLSEYVSNCRPALEVICAVREPLQRSELAGLLGWSKYKMRSVAARLGSLFPMSDGRVRPFHQSVRDWLIDPKRAGRYWIDVAAQEQRLAELAWREFKSGVNTMGSYCITHGPSHLAASHMKTKLKALLLAPDWVHAKLKAAGVVALLADYDLALAMHRRRVLNPATSTAVGTGPQIMAKAAKAEVEVSVTDDLRTSALQIVQDAIRISSHVIDHDDGQFASQLVGRLLPYQGLPAIEQFTTKIVADTQTFWLRPLHPALHPPGTSLIRVLRGHSASVQGVALSGDGRRMISAAFDQTLKVWDVESGREMRTLQEDSLLISGVAVTRDGRRAVSASSDCTLKVWDVKSGCKLRTLQGHSGWVNGVALSEDGRRAVSASSDCTLKVWDVESGRELRTLRSHSGSVHGVALSKDGRRAVSASHDQTLKVWDVESGREVRTLRGHFGSVQSVALSEDGQRAVSASDDQTLKVWDVESGREMRTLRGHSHAVTGVALSRDGRRVVSTSADKTARVWDLEGGHDLRTLWRHSGGVSGVALSRDGRRAVSASYDCTLKVWDVERGCELHMLQGHSGAVQTVALSGDGRRAVSASSDCTLKVWDVERGCELHMLQGHSHAVTGVALSGDGRRAVSACQYGTLKVWDVERGRELRSLQRQSHTVYGVALSGDGRRAVSASSDCTLKVWDVERGRELRILQGHSGMVLGVALSRDGRRAVSASYDCTLKVWDVERGRELLTLQGHSGWVNGVALSEDGRRALSASHDHTLKLWDAEHGTSLATFTCDGLTLCCALSRDGKIVAGDHGGRVYFLSLEEPAGNVVSAKD